MNTNPILVNGKEIDYSLLPDYMRNGMRLYIESGILPGSFLTAVLVNDFMGACTRADSFNQYHLYDYAKFLYMHAPANCYGSPEIVKKWIKERNE